MFLKIIKSKRIAVVACAIILLTSCTWRYGFLPSSVQTGLASWYGPKYHGRFTSSQEKFNMYDLTAAHNSLPFGTLVMVTNSKNGKSVMVRINDRGPFIKGRIIDLSYSAAKAIDMIGPGVVPVKIEILKEISPLDSAKHCSVEVGTFTSSEKALHLKSNLKKKYKNVYLSTFKTPNQTYYIVRIKTNNIKSAQKICRKLQNDGIEGIILAKK